MTNELGLDAVARLVEFAHHNRLFSVVSGIRLRLLYFSVRSSSRTITALAMSLPDGK